MATNNSTNDGTRTTHGIFVAQGTASPNFLTLTNGQLLIGSTGVDPVAASITAGTGITVTPGAGTITIAATASGFTWTDVTGTTATLAPNNGYIADNAGLVTLTLPATAIIGATFTILGKGAGGWTIAQNASQFINFGSVVTTVGAGGSLSSSNRWDSLTITCVTTDVGFVVREPVGNITYV